MVMGSYKILYSNIYVNMHTEADKHGKFSVMIGTLLYNFGSCGRHSKHTDQMHIPLRPLLKGNSLRR